MGDAQCQNVVEGGLAAVMGYCAHSIIALPWPSCPKPWLVSWRVFLVRVRQLGPVHVPRLVGVLKAWELVVATLRGTLFFYGTVT